MRPSKEHLARPLAEVVALNAADAAVKHYEVRRTPAGLLHSAWVHTEYALNQECSPQAASYYIETAQMLIGNIINKGDLIADQKVCQDTILHSLVLSTYIPLFMARKEKKVIQNSDCRMAYESLGKALQYLQPLEVDEPPQWRMTETAVLALSARIGRPDLLLYPASPREEGSEVDAYNHDSYFHSHDNKLPVQQKLLPTPCEYDEDITILTLDPLITKAMRATSELNERNWTIAEKVNLLLGRIVADTAGVGLSRKEERFLNVLTRAVAAHHRVPHGITERNAA